MELDKENLIASIKFLIDFRKGNEKLYLNCTRLYMQTLQTNYFIDKFIGIGIGVKIMDTAIINTQTKLVVFK